MQRFEIIIRYTIMHCANQHAMTIQLMLETFANTIPFFLNLPKKSRSTNLEKKKLRHKIVNYYDQLPRVIGNGTVSEKTENVSCLDPKKKRIIIILGAKKKLNQKNYRVAWLIPKERYNNPVV